MPHLNWLAVLVAAVSTFLIGGLWYSPAMFGRAWMSANGSRRKTWAEAWAKFSV